MSPNLETMAFFDKLWDARLVRVDAQLQRIEGTAYWLGKQLARHEVIRDDVNRRLSALCAPRPYDDDAWVPCDIAEDAAEDALRRGMEAGR